MRWGTDKVGEGFIRLSVGVEATADIVDAIGKRARPALTRTAWAASSPAAGWFAPASPSSSWRLLWSATALIVPPTFKSRAERIALETLGRRLTIGDVAFNPWTLALRVDDIALAGASDAAPPQLQIRQLRSKVSVSWVFRLAPVIDRLEIDAPMVRLTRLADGRYDIDDVLARLAAAPAKDGDEPAQFALHNIVVHGGAADFVDQPLKTTHRLRELELGVPFLSALPSEREINVEPRLAFTLDGSRFDSAAVATPFAERGAGTVKIRLDRFDVGPWLGYLPQGLPVRLQSGLVERRPVAGVRAAAEAVAAPRGRGRRGRPEGRRCRGARPAPGRQRQGADRRPAAARADRQAGADRHRRAACARRAQRRGQGEPAARRRDAVRRRGAGGARAAADHRRRARRARPGREQQAGVGGQRRGRRAAGRRAGRRAWPPCRSAPASSTGATRPPRPRRRSPSRTSASTPRRSPGRSRRRWSSRARASSARPRTRASSRSPARATPPARRVKVGLDDLPLVVARPYLQGLLRPPLAGSLEHRPHARLEARRRRAAAARRCPADRGRQAAARRREDAGARGRADRAARCARRHRRPKRGHRQAGAAGAAAAARPRRRGPLERRGLARRGGAGAGRRAGDARAPAAVVAPAVVGGVGAPAASALAPEPRPPGDRQGPGQLHRPQPRVARRARSRTTSRCRRRAGRSTARRRCRSSCAPGSRCRPGRAAGRSAPASSAASTPAAS